VCCDGGNPNVRRMVGPWRGVGMRWHEPRGGVWRPRNHASKQDERWDGSMEEKVKGVSNLGKLSVKHEENSRGRSDWVQFAMTLSLMPNADVIVEQESSPSAARHEEMAQPSSTMTAWRWCHSPSSTAIGRWCSTPSRPPRRRQRQQSSWWLPSSGSLLGG